MRKRKNALLTLLMICILAVTVLGNTVSRQMAVSAAAKQNVKSLAVRIGKKDVTNKSITLTEGQTAKLNIKTNPAKAKNSVKFSSGNKSVAIVSKTGNVRAKKAGSARIKAVISGRYIKKSVWVKVRVREQENTKEPSSTDTDLQPSAESPDTQVETSAGKNILIAYFSRTGENYGVGVIEKGNTAIIADMIAEQTKGTEFEVAAVHAYPDVYSECTEAAKLEQEQNARPQLRGTLPAIEDYDTIFIGYPIWWSDMPMAVYTFLESYDWSGKTVIPFCTHAGSGLSGTEAKIRQTCQGAEVKSGLAITGTMAQNDQAAAGERVTDWLAGLGYKSNE